MLQRMLINWKTTSAGVTLVLTGVGAMTKCLHEGTPPPVVESLISIVSGVGLIFSKDHDVTGGTRPSEP